jgi:quercetin dioxygenase-like cupin family protein
MTSSLLTLPLDEPLTLPLDGCLVRTWTGPPTLLDGGTVFGCLAQPTTVQMDGDDFLLRADCWFVAPEGALVKGGRGLAIVVPGYHGLRQLGGPLEATGRLRYMDGCSDTVLVAPPRRGEPCLNHLHVPPFTRQTTHTHPSLRIGLVARGHGTCLTPEGAQPLRPHVAWIIPPGLRHAFHTATEALDVIAWHPDSDVGPTDDDHPMRNRTLL